MILYFRDLEDVVLGCMNAHVRKINVSEQICGASKTIITNCLCQGQVVSTCKNPEKNKEAKEDHSRSVRKPLT